MSYKGSLKYIKFLNLVICRFLPLSIIQFINVPVTRLYIRWKYLGFVISKRLHFRSRIYIRGFIKVKIKEKKNIKKRIRKQKNCNGTLKAKDKCQK